MKSIILGFPKEVGKEIELPDFGELITYPIFVDATPEAVRKYGSEFQKKLLDLAPLRHDKKVMAVSTDVTFLTPNTRAIAAYTNIPGTGEWHIDEMTQEDFKKEESEVRVHFFASYGSTLTEFNEEPFIFEYDEDKIKTSDDYLRYINSNLQLFNIKPKKIEPNRFVTFTKHLHRAVNPKAIELRYIFRVREMNRDWPALNDSSAVVNQTSIFDAVNHIYIRNLERNKNEIKIFIPNLQLKEEVK
jgi:hypothetical protein